MRVVIVGPFEPPSGDALPESEASLEGLGDVERAEPRHLVLEDPRAGLDIGADHVFTMSNNDLVWSVGSVVKRIFHLPSPIQHVVWCGFRSKFDLSRTIHAPRQSTETFFLCLHHETGISFYHPGGQFYDCVLPYPVHPIHSIPSGLLLSRRTSETEREAFLTQQDGGKPQPVLFSMRHPLEQIRPVSYLSVSPLLHGLYEQASRSDFYESVVDPNWTVCFSDKQLSLLVMHHRLLRRHTFWLIHTRHLPDSPLSSSPSPTSSPESIYSHFIDNLLVSLAAGDKDESMKSVSTDALLDRPDSGADLFLEWIFDEPDVLPISLSACDGQVDVAKQNGSHKENKNEGGFSASSSCFICHDHNERQLVCLFDQASHTLRAFSISPSNQHKDKWQVKAAFELKDVLSAISVPSTRSSRRFTQNSGLLDLLILDTHHTISLFVGHRLVSQLAIELPLNVSPISLSDPVGRQFSLQLSDNSTLRCMVPQFPVSDLLTDVLQSLNSVLPLSLYHNLLCSLVNEISAELQRHHLAESSVSIETSLVSAFFQRLATFRSSSSSSSSSQEIEPEDDWDFLLNSDFHKSQRALFHDLVPVSKTPKSSPTTSLSSKQWSDLVQSLSSFAPKILLAIHLLYEDYKLNTLRSTQLSSLASDLLNLSISLGASEYVEYYCRDLGQNPAESLAQIAEAHGQRQGRADAADQHMEMEDEEDGDESDSFEIDEDSEDHVLHQPVPSVYDWLSKMLRFQAESQDPSGYRGFPLLCGTTTPCEWTRKICRFYYLLLGLPDRPVTRSTKDTLDSVEGISFTGHITPQTLQSLAQHVQFPVLRSLLDRHLSLANQHKSLTSKPFPFVPIRRRSTKTTSSSSRMHLDKEPPSSPTPSREAIFHRVVLEMVKENFQLQDLRCLPWGVALPLHEAISFSRSHPPANWPPAAYLLINRNDLALQGTDLELMKGLQFASNNQHFVAQSKPEDASSQSYHDLHQPDSGLNAPEKSPAGTSDIIKLKDEELIFMRFGRDERILEAQRLLHCSQSPLVHITQDEINASNEQQITLLQQTKLYHISQRTAALTVGRGMLTLNNSSAVDVTSQRLPVPFVYFGGRLSSTNAAINLQNYPDGSLIQIEYVQWPSFHNGTAAALRLPKRPSTHLERLHQYLRAFVSRSNFEILGESAELSSLRSSYASLSSSIESSGRDFADKDESPISVTWISYNKPKRPTCQHAGFLMALGLLGHLKVLDIPRIIEYFKENHEFTTVGLLIGLGASYIGTMDSNISTALSIHLPSVHPQTTVNLDLPSNVRIAASIGLGLLYATTCNRRMVEVLIQQIGQVIGTDDKHTRRESFSLASGIALGFVTLSHGNHCPGLSDLQVESQLAQYIHGSDSAYSFSGSGLFSGSGPSGSKASEGDLGTSNKSNPLMSSTHSWNAVALEPKTVNTNVSAPGAIVALTLMYLQTNNHQAASILSLPETLFEMESVRPDHLLLRMLGRHLILWDDIKPTDTWLQSQMPVLLRRPAADLSKSSQVKVEFDPNNLFVADHQEITLQQSRLHLICGACLAISLRYASTGHLPAFRLIMHYTQMLLSLKRQRRAIKDAGGLMISINKQMAESCLMVLVVSLAVLMAGSGHLQTFQLLRHLRKRSHETDSSINYGSHMAISISIGMLFLGAGLDGFRRTPLAIAALLCSIFPSLPNVPQDDSVHLQALRHLYVLATERRCLVTRDVDSNHLCYVPLLVDLKGTKTHRPTTIRLTSPCLLPEFTSIQSIRIHSPRYWTTTLDFGNNHHRLLVSQVRTLFVKRKTGFLSYKDDPKGLRSISSRSFSRLLSSTNQQQLEFVESFSADPTISSFVRLLCLSSDIQSADSARAAESQLHSLSQVLSTSSSGSLRDPMMSLVKGVTEEEVEMSREFSRFCAMALYESLTHDKPEVLPLYLYLWLGVHRFLSDPSVSFVKNLSLMCDFYDSHSLPRPLVDKDFLESVRVSFDQLFSGKMAFRDGLDLPGSLWKFVQTKSDPSKGSLSFSLFSSLLSFYGLPSARSLDLVSQSLPPAASLPEIAFSISDKLPGLSAPSLLLVAEMFSRVLSCTSSPS